MFLRFVCTLDVGRWTYHCGLKGESRYVFSTVFVPLATGLPMTGSSCNTWQICDPVENLNIKRVAFQFLRKIKKRGTITQIYIYSFIMADLKRKADSQAIVSRPILVQQCAVRPLVLTAYTTTTTLIRLLINP